MDNINKILKEKIKSKILEELMKNELSFSQILEKTKLIDHGQLNYHLKQLLENGLIKKDEKYSITNLGEKMGIYIKQFQLKEMYPLSVVCPIIRNEKGEVLMLKRAKEPYKGYYGFPGGKIAIGETIKEAAIREAYEETKLSIKPIKTVGFYPSIIMKDNELRFHANLIPIITEPIIGDEKIVLDEEHDTFTFIDPTNIGNNKLVPGNEEVLKNLSKEGFQFSERIIT